MMIMPAPIAATKLSAPTATGMGENECAEITAPTGPFEFLLPAEDEELPTIPSDETENESSDLKDESDAVPTLAQQTNLAALLYAVPVTPVVPRPDARPEALQEVAPAVKQTGIEEQGAQAAADSPEVPEARVQEPPARSKDVPEFPGSKITRPDAPITGSVAATPADVPVAKKDFAKAQVVPDLKVGAPPQMTSPLNPASAPAVAAASEQAQPAAPRRSTPSAETLTAREIGAAITPTPEAAVATLAPSAALPSPSAKSTSLGPIDNAAEKAAPAVADRTPVEATPRTSEPAEFAALPKKGLGAAETPAANSSATSAPTTASRDGAAILRMAADADQSLPPEQSVDGKRLRGTTGAKAIPAMNQAPVMPPTSRPENAPATSTSAGFVMTGGALGEELSQGSQVDRKDFPTGASDANTADAETFSLTTPAGFSLAARSAPEMVAEAASSVPKPMATAAMVEELGMKLEHFQQTGKNRMDLRLSLEGGGEVSIQLQVRDGAVHASFQTASSELREALQNGWSQLANRSESAGLPLAEPIFKSPSNPSSNPGQQDFRERRQEPRQEPNSSFDYYAAAAQPKRAGSSSVPVRRTTSGFNTWA